MSIDKKLLDILCCPVTKTPVTMLSIEKLRTLNSLISQGTVVTVDNKPIKTPLEEALITSDGKTIYRIDEQIPVMLSDQAISTLQFDNF